MWDASHKMSNHRLMSDSDGFDVNNPFKLPRMYEDMQPFDLAVVYFTVSSHKYRPPPGQRIAIGGPPEPDVVEFNLFGAVKLASLADL